MNTSTPRSKRLLGQVRDAIRLKYYAYRTEQTYMQTRTQDSAFG